MKKEDKVERYDWVKPGDRGRLCKIDIDELRFDYAYQRREVSDANTLALARSFDWVAFNVIVVMERANGDKYVVDGQQRLLAARRRGDIRQVPCVLFQSDGSKHEAQAFLALNTHRVRVSASAKFHASVRAGINPEKQIDDWLRLIGLCVREDGQSSGVICFPGHLIRSWKINAEACKQAITLQRIINGDEPLHSYIHNGLFWLVHNRVNVGESVDKLISLGGRPAMLRAINSVAIETGVAANNLKTAGIGLLRLINHRRRNKITVSADEPGVTK